MASPIQSAALGAIRLTVSDLDRSLEYYQQAIGFRLHWQNDDVAALGAGEDDLLFLHHNPDASPKEHGVGLYHFAVLLPERIYLAQFLRHLAEIRTPVYGLSEHYISEAIYLYDPDGIGIEVYRDRPRSDWTRPDGSLHVATVALDVEDLLGVLTGDTPRWDGLPPGTKIGHMHMHVTHMPAAEAFYQDFLGLDMMIRFGDLMSFLSYEGYHHHIGLRPGHAPHPTGGVGVDWYTLRVDSPDVVAKLGDQLSEADIATEERDGDLFFHDPGGNGIRVTASRTA